MQKGKHGAEKKREEKTMKKGNVKLNKSLYSRKA